MKALTRLTSFLMVFIGVGIIVRTLDAGGGARAIGILVGAAVRRRRRRAAVPDGASRGDEPRDPEPRDPRGHDAARADGADPARLSAAGRMDTLPQLKRGLGSPALFGIVQGFIGGLDLLRGRRRRREGARAHVGGLPRRRDLLRRARALLRRGRLAAPGARRRDGDRPLRLQRAVELRRGLGDPASTT